MKKIFMILLTLICFSVLKADPFCDGHRAGYKAGYCYDQQFNCYVNIYPTCPVVRPHNRNNYEGGYAEGFMLGRNSR